MLISENQLQKGKNNFDFIRFFAAFLVFFEHSFAIFTGNVMDFDLSREIFQISSAALGVNIFFLISGFLITLSFEKSKNIFTYFLNRVLRIFPALIVVVLLSVLVLGLFFSEMNFSEFIFDKTTLQYCQNMFVFRTYYYLPEVFLTNPLNPSVNGSLWTIAYEFTCYLILPILLIIPFLKNKFGILTLLVFCFFALLFFEKEIYKLVIPFLGITFSSLSIPFLYFLSGVCYFKFRGVLKFNYIGLLVVLVFLVLMKFEIIPRTSLAFVLPYLVLYFVFSEKIKLNKFGKFGDFSYGFYLYAFPVQQAICCLFFKETSFQVLFTLSFIITLLFSVFSWHLIEKPFLNLKIK